MQFDSYLWQFGGVHCELDFLINKPDHYYILLKVALKHPQFLIYSLRMKLKQIFPKQLNVSYEFIDIKRDCNLIQNLAKITNFLKFSSSQCKIKINVPQNI